jgi:hypothetical protein
MDLRICLKCGYIWQLYSDDFLTVLCKGCGEHGEDLGKVILELRRKNLIHHGKIK